MRRNEFVLLGQQELLRVDHARIVGRAFAVLQVGKLDYRMHNKLMVADNAIGLIGGRNIGDQYFQIDPNAQYADDDVFAAGPIARKLSATFDEYWNSDLSIPAEALADEKSPSSALHQEREALHDHGRQLRVEGNDYANRVASGEPLNGIMAGRLPLTWAQAQLICDSPDKKKVETGAMVGKLMQRAVAQATSSVQSELLMVTPYVIPGDEGMQLFLALRQRGVRVRILTNSLESSPVLVTQSGYMHYRLPLLAHGVELYEIRSLLGNTRGSGQTAAISRAGNYSLHAKLFVFDRQRLFIGSMNFDQRSMHLNTEIGLIIDSPELAQQVAARFEAMVQAANAYRLELRQNDVGDTPRLTWHTEEQGQGIEYDVEPARSAWQRLLANILTLLPLDREL